MRSSFKLPFSLFSGLIFSLLTYQFFSDKRCSSLLNTSPWCLTLEIALIPSLAIVFAIVIYLIIPKND